MSVTITAQDVKNEIFVETGVPLLEIKCYNCAKWGWNCGKAINSCGGSRCLCRKETTYSYQFCRKFEKKA